MISEIAGASVSIAGVLISDLCIQQEFHIDSQVVERGEMNFRDFLRIEVIVVLSIQLQKFKIDILLKI